MKRKLKFIIISSLILIFIAIFVLVIVENNMVQINSYTVASNKLNADFNLKIAQISDFHNSKKLLDKTVQNVSDSAPDIIVITGDLIDSRKTNLEIATNLLEKISKIAPCYYVSGNHEARIKSEYDLLKEKISDFNVTILENESVELNVGNEKINLIGLTDPRFNYESDSKKKACEQIHSDLAPLIKQDMYNLVLCHRPEAFAEYTALSADLVLSGHAHGGQIILFGIGAVAPNQGIFPKYIKGMYKDKNTTMVVSRGIGNSLFPFRLNNKPEVVEITLKGE